MSEVTPKSRRERVLVTGASSGIGEAFALHHAVQGRDVILTGRNQSALRSVAECVESLGVSASVIEADLSTAAGVESLIGFLPEIDVLVANAGITHAASVGTTDRDELDRLAYLMSAGIVRLCEAVVPGMAERGHGTVVVMSSIATFAPMRKGAPYAAAKSHATAYARSLALEVEPFGVKVVAVCPGYVRTDLHRRAGLQHLTRSVPSWMWLESEDVIAATERALRRGKVVVVPGFVYRLVQPFLNSRLAQRVWQKMTRRR